MSTHPIYRCMGIAVSVYAALRSLEIFAHAVRWVLS